MLRARQFCNNITIYPISRLPFWCPPSYFRDHGTFGQHLDRDHADWRGRHKKVEVSLRSPLLRVGAATTQDKSPKSHFSLVTKALKVTLSALSVHSSKDGLSLIEKASIEFWFRPPGLRSHFLYFFWDAPFFFDSLQKSMKIGF